MIKFENVLRNIEFDTAKIQMETEYYGTYNFFWKSKIVSKFILHALIPLINEETIDSDP
jgi:hypothetical protein